MFVVETNRLILKSATTEDASALFDILGEDQVKKYIHLNCSDVDSLAKEINNFLYKKDSFFLKIIDKSSKKIIGSILALNNSNSTLNISYFISGPYQNQGFMAEALRAFINDLYNDIDYNFLRLEFTIKKDNIPSNKVMEKSGAKLFRELKDDNIYRIKIEPLELL